MVSTLACWPWAKSTQVRNKGRTLDVGFQDLGSLSSSTLARSYETYKSFSLYCWEFAGLCEI